MGNYLNPGNEKFRRMIQSEIYVDKTGMIKYTNSVLDTAQNYVCVSRPRRFGKSMAATPSGLKAMEELQKNNPHKDTATNEMCSFLILNISSLQLIPINIIAYRSQYGSVNPTKVLIPGLIATLGSTIVAVIYIKWKDRKR